MAFAKGRAKNKEVIRIASTRILRADTSRRLRYFLWALLCLVAAGFNGIFIVFMDDRFVDAVCGFGLFAGLGLTISFLIYTFTVFSTTFIIQERVLIIKNLWGTKKARWNEISKAEMFERKIDVERRRWRRIVITLNSGRIIRFDPYILTPKDEQTLIDTLKETLLRMGKRLDISIVA